MKKFVCRLIECGGMLFVTCGQLKFISLNSVSSASGQHGSSTLAAVTEGAKRSGSSLLLSPNDWLGQCQDVLYCRAVRDFAGTKTAQLLLFLLCCSAGMFAASSAFLPSTFVMYTLTLAAAAVIDNHPRAVIAYAAVGVLLGWPVAGMFVLFAQCACTSWLVIRLEEVPLWTTHTKSDAR